LWRTEHFARSHESEGFVFDVVDRFADLPRLIFKMSDIKREQAHFSAWWGAIPHRSYPSDAVHDLYWLHELYHAGEMVYLPELSPEGFARKMFDNELDASVTSEIRVYFELPGLREAAFPHGIFADRFLCDGETQERFRREPTRVLAELRARRRDAMFAERPKDAIETWIRRFAHQNLVWAAVWARRYDEVERAMGRLRRLTHERGRAEALDAHLAWLQSAAVSFGADIPFPREAEAFSAVYWKNKADYEDDMVNMRRH
jgi:hypothetical protein